MKRVAIVGSPGAGKTTFAKKLALKTGLPLIHLDYYYHQSEHDYYNNQKGWLALVEKLSKQDKWIMDGHYKSSFTQRFARADTIIFLDYSRFLTMYRATKRRIQYRNKLRDDMPDEWKENLNRDFVKYVWKFNDDYRHIVVSAIDSHKHKNIYVFTNRKQARLYLDSL